MSSQQTVNALLARGFDSTLAGLLAGKGYTITKLMQCPKSELRELGLSDKLVAVVHDSNRPPIPAETLNKLLYESRRMCCVCREPRKPIILHHIDEWHLSRSHSEDNLVVLCLNCHGDVHTKRELSQNITPAQLRHHKEMWIAEVKTDILEERTTPSSQQFGLAVWDYFNHNRILDMAEATQVRVQDMKPYKGLVAGKLIQKNGSAVLSPQDRSRKPSYLYEVANRSIMALYQELLGHIVPKLQVVDLTDSWNRSTANMLESGAAVIYAGGWRFRKHKRNGPIYGSGQMRTGYVQKNGIRLTFDFDAWETTTGSSWGHLSGSWSCTGICLVRSLERIGKLLVIQASALAIGTGFKITT